MNNIDKKDTQKDIKKWQIRIFAACFIAYTAAYICRVNISVALPKIQEALNLSGANVGLIGTSFFWVYAIGQLVNGYIGDKISSKKFIFVGLLISALLNAFLGFSNTLFIMIILWGANGIFQSMLWGPIVKTLANWFPEEKNNQIASYISFSMIIGYLIAWGVSGMIVEKFGWKWAFWFPAGIVLILAFLWYFMTQDRPEDVGIFSIHKSTHDEDEDRRESEQGGRISEPRVENGARGISFWKLILGTNLLFVATTGITQGIIRDTISFWGPKLITDTQNLSSKSAIGAILVIPILNLVGIMFGGWLNRLLKFRERITVVTFMLGSSLVSAGLVFLINTSSILNVLLIASSSAFMFAVGPAMTALIPLRYKRYGRVSSVAGFIDFSIYLGSGLAATLTGLMIDYFSWNNVFIIWCLVSLVGAFTMGISIFKKTRYPI